MIYICCESDMNRICSIINDAARVYEGIIPATCYRCPYMTAEELDKEMSHMTFFGWDVNGELVGVIGFEPGAGVTIVHHAYVLPRMQRQGIGSRILNHLMRLVSTPRILAGAWADARWAVDFYQKHGFQLLPDKDGLLETYWNIPREQLDASVVLGRDMTPSKGETDE